MALQNPPRNIGGCEVESGLIKISWAPILVWKGTEYKCVQLENVGLKRGNINITYGISDKNVDRAKGIDISNNGKRQ